MLELFGVFEITVKKMKEPAFALLLVIAVLIGASVSEMEQLSFRQDSGVLFGLISLEQGEPLLTGFVVIFLMTAIVAIFSGATDIPKDIESRMIMLVLTKPITRIEYLVGKYLGIVAVCICFFLTGAITATLVHWARANEIYHVQLLIRQFFMLLALFPLVAVTIMFSTFLADIGAMVVTAAYVFFSMLISAISVFVDMLPKSLEVVSLVHVIACFFPNFFYFFNSCKVSGIILPALIAYSFSITAIFLLVASFQMNRRDMI